MTRWIAAGICALLCACGHKPKLYLPGQKDEPPAAAQPVPSANSTRPIDRDN